MGYTSLIASADFTPVRADVITSAGGILSVVIVIIAVGMIMRVLSR